MRRLTPKGSFRLSQASFVQWGLNGGLIYIYIYIQVYVCTDVAHTHTWKSCNMRYKATSYSCWNSASSRPSALSCCCRRCCSCCRCGCRCCCAKQWMNRVVAVVVVSAGVYQVEIAQLVDCCHNKQQTTSNKRNKKHSKFLMGFDSIIPCSPLWTTGSVWNYSLENILTSFELRSTWNIFFKDLKM